MPEERFQLNKVLVSNYSHNLVVNPVRELLLVTHTINKLNYHEALINIAMLLMKSLLFIPLLHMAYLRKEGFIGRYRDSVSVSRHRENGTGVCEEPLVPAGSE